MNIETAISNFTKSYAEIHSDESLAHYIASRIVDGNGRNWEMVIRELENETRMAQNSLSAQRRAEAAAFQTFANEIREALAGETPSPVEVPASAAAAPAPQTPYTYEQYAAYYSRQEQPYMSREQWLEEKGYEFGKVLNDMNADAEHYAAKINRNLGYNQAQRDAIYAGIARATTENAQETLIANTVNQVSVMLDMAERFQASPYDEAFEAESFERGVNSMIYATDGVEYAPVMNLTGIKSDGMWGLDKDEMERSRQAFRDGVELGGKIMNAWKAAGL